MVLYITGLSGFVGRYLENNLRNSNFNLVGLGRKELKNKNYDFSRSSSILHLAGKAHDLKNASNPDEYYEVNFELSKRIFDSFLKSEAKKFIFISSVKAAADSVNDILSEESLPNPLSHYGKSKLMAEQYIQSQPLPKGKSYYILRPCMIHGPGNKGNLNLLYKFVRTGIPYPLGAFDNRRSFLSVENLCFVIKKILENDVPSGIYNVADDEALSTNQVVSILADSLNRKPKLLFISSRLVRLIAKIGTILHLPFNAERLGKLTENYVVSNVKVKAAINEKLPLSSKEGLILTANSFE